MSFQAKDWMKSLGREMDAVRRSRRDCTTGSTGQCLTQPIPCTYVECQNEITAECNSLDCEALLASGTPTPTAVNPALETAYISIGVGLFVLTILLFLYWCYRRNRNFRDRRRAAAYGLASVSELRKQIEPSSGNDHKQPFGKDVSCELVHDDPKLWVGRKNEPEASHLWSKQEDITGTGPSTKVGFSQSDSAIPHSTFRRSRSYYRVSEAGESTIVASDSAIRREMFSTEESNSISAETMAALITRTSSHGSGRYNKQMRDASLKKLKVSRLSTNVRNEQEAKQSFKIDAVIEGHDPIIAGQNPYDCSNSLQGGSSKGIVDSRSLLTHSLGYQDPHFNDEDIVFPQSSVNSYINISADTLKNSNRGYLQARPDVRVQDSSNNPPTDLKSYIDVANIFRKQGRFEDALREYDRALHVHVDAYGEAHIRVLDIRMAIASLYHEHHKKDEALASFKRIRFIASQSKFAPDSSMAVLYTRIGDVLVEMGYHQEAVKTYREARSIFEQHLEDHVPDLEDLSLKLGAAYENLSKHKKSLKEYSIVLRSKAKRLGECRLEVVDVRKKLAKIFECVKNFDDALREYTLVLDVYTRKYGDDHSSVREVRTTIGKMYLKSSRYLDAVVEFKCVLNSLIQHAGSEHTIMARAQKDIGDAYKGAGMLAQAEQSYLEALNSFAKNTRGCESTQEEVVTEESLGDVYILQDRKDDALLKWQCIISMRRRLSMDKNDEYLNALKNIAHLCLDLELFDMALPHYQELIDALMKLHGQNSESVADMRFKLGSLYSRWVDFGSARFEEAQSEFNRALKIRLQLFGTEHPSILPLRSNLADSLKAMGRYEEATVEAKEALRLVIATTYPDSHKSPGVANSYARLAGIHEAQQLFQEAIDNFEYALRIREQAFGPEHQKVIETRKKLAALSEYLKCLVSRRTSQDKMAPERQARPKPGFKSAAHAAAERRSARAGKVLSRHGEVCLQ